MHWIVVLDPHHSLQTRGQLSVGSSTLPLQQGIQTPNDHTGPLSDSGPLVLALDSLNH